MSAKGLRSRQVKARALVLAAVVASSMMRVVAAASSLPRMAVGTPTGIKGVTCVMVEAEPFMHQDRNAWPTTLLCLVD